MIGFPHGALVEDINPYRRGCRLYEVRGENSPTARWSVPTLFAHNRHARPAVRRPQWRVRDGGTQRATSR